MSSYVIARRYAQALYSLSVQEGVLDDVKQSLLDIHDLTGKLPALKGFLANPLLTMEEQKNIIQKMFEGRVPARVFVFLNFVITKRRLDILPEMIEAFEDLYRSEHNQILIRVQSAQPLDDALKSTLIKRLEEITHKRIEAQYALDPSMIGGIRVFAAGKLYEYSFNGELQDYKRKALAQV